MDTHTSHWPVGFISRMSEWLGPQAPEFFTALAKRDIGLRLNSRRGALDALASRIPWQTAPVPWCPEGLWLQEEAPAGGHPYHLAGVYYMQDPSAMAAAVLLDPRPGEWILDLAAAPGSKATHIGARMQGQGVLVANEIMRHRVPILAMNLERMGVANAVVTNEMPERLAGRWPGLFDAVLVDAPCSGEGTFSRDSQAIRDWSLATIAGNARRQSNILYQTAPLVRLGGRLLYGTCTFAPEENEGVIAGFLEQHPDFELSPLPDIAGLHPGHPEWVGAPALLRRTGRFWPHTGPGHGHFYALLRRRGEATDLPGLWAGTATPGRVLNLYRETLGTVLVGAPPEEGLFLNKDDQLYICPVDPKLLEGLRILRPGWWVASQRHGKVNPDHALAMALAPEQVQARVDLEPEDRRLIQFVRGGFWQDAGPPGFVLVTVDGFPLGWGKRSGGRLRSRYPIHLRKQAPGLAF
ncbi:MAG: RsmF rRNA methyltransferase first C-terminal domain-containing protein [Anaerolineae bacterium]|nr:RsmF rRNA methyltransferase first C-terminal domain-containing protein [Anaerolineae bacterium]